MAKDWYKLDNAAKIFPVIYSKHDTSSFRLSCVFYENIQFQYLQEALKEALKRFPTFCVKLKRGLFWYYFEHNYNEPIIQEEKSNIFHSVRLRENHGFMFSLNYYGKRLSIEIFHALSDGTGGMDFFKAICYYYLILTGKTIENHGEIKTNAVERLTIETEDDFLRNYDSSIQKYGKEPKAYRLKGKMYSNHWCGLIHLQMNVNELKQVAHQYQTTITQYVGACILYSIYQYHLPKHKRTKSVNLFIPVNARKFFDSMSVRNFVLYLRTHCDFNQSNLTFEDILNMVKETFKEELTKEKMQARIVSNVSLERNFFVRILPLFIKKICMKIGYKTLGEDMNTISYSNLGIIEIPKDMQEFIQRFEFSLGSCKKTPINVASVTYQDRFVLTFSSKLIDRKLIRGVVNKMVEDHLSIVVDTNDLEVES